MSSFRRLRRAPWSTYHDEAQVRRPGPSTRVVNHCEVYPIRLARVCEERKTVGFLRAEYEDEKEIEKKEKEKEKGGGKRGVTIGYSSLYVHIYA